VLVAFGLRANVGSQTGCEQRNCELSSRKLPHDAFLLADSIRGSDRGFSRSPFWSGFGLQFALYGNSGRSGENDAPEDSLKTDKASSLQRPRVRRSSWRYYLFSFFFGALLFACFFPNTRPKILSTFFSWRSRSKAYSICFRGTLEVISLSRRI